MVGITSQKEIEKALREAIESGSHPGTGSLGAVMRLEIPGLGLVHVVEGDIRLE